MHELFSFLFSFSSSLGHDKRYYVNVVCAISDLGNLKTVKVKLISIGVLRFCAEVL